MTTAWTVNFNLALSSSFEPDLKAIRNLIELSLGSPYSSPPKIVFASSIGVFQCKYYDVHPIVAQI